MKTFANPLGAYPKQQNRSDSYEEFDATELYCPKCKQAVPEQVHPAFDHLGLAMISRMRMSENFLARH